ALGVAALGLALGDPVAEGLLGLLGTAPVPDAHVVAVQPDLADPAVGQLAAALGVVDRLRVHDHGPLRQRDVAAGDLRDGVLRAGIDLHHASGVELAAVHIGHLGLVLGLGGRAEQGGL